MRLREFEGKKLFKEYGINVPEGGVASDPDEAIEIAEKLGGEVVLKAQVLAGGRGLAGGIKFASSISEVRDKAENLLKAEIKGLAVEKILVEEKLAIDKEYYGAIMLDRTRKKPVLLGTTEGGVNIEKLGKEKPDLIVNQTIDTLIGVENYHGLSLLSQFDISNELKTKVAGVFSRLYQIFKDKEAFLVEVNPLVITREQKVVAADAKIMIDTAASYLKDDTSPRYIPLEGDIGILANGAGLTMTTMDVVQELGGNPANFLEVGGEFYKKADQALEYLLEKKPELKGILINLFGAYARTDIITRQLIDVLLERKLEIPISFRIRGTGEKKAREIVETEFNQSVNLNLEDAVWELLEAI